jgi:NAD(P)-dependent dehydrogenase (short-subunit alcohol dehydrogenase family)
VNDSYAGKVAFVTRAATGIGRATAVAFARAGANVVVADVSEEGNQETAHAIEQAGVHEYEIPLMLKQGGGAIVNTASGAGVKGFAGQAAYAAAKHGVMA